MIIAGQKIVELNKPNLNGRIYSDDCFNKILKNSYYGTIGMPNSLEQIDLCKVSHMAKNLRKENGFIVCDVVVLDTSNGEMLRLMLDSGMDISYRAAGSGKIDENGNVTEYEILSVNAVLTESAA